MATASVRLYCKVAWALPRESANFKFTSPPLRCSDFQLSTLLIWLFFFCVCPPEWRSQRCRFCPRWSVTGHLFHWLSQMIWPIKTVSLGLNWLLKSAPVITCNVNHITLLELRGQLLRERVGALNCASAHRIQFPFQGRPRAYNVLKYKPCFMVCVGTKLLVPLTWNAQGGARHTWLFFL